MNQLVIFILYCNLTFSCGLKLEHWSDPIIEGSIIPNALADASRKPKLFFGVRKRNVLSVFPLVFEYLFIFWLHSRHSTKYFGKINQIIWHSVFPWHFSSITHYRSSQIFDRASVEELILISLISNFRLQQRPLQQLLW